jgi:hypothetical protein
LEIKKLKSGSLDELVEEAPAVVEQVEEAEAEKPGEAKVEEAK